MKKQIDIHLVALYLSGGLYGHFRQYFPKVEFVLILIGYSGGLMTMDKFELIQKFTKEKYEFYFEALNLLKHNQEILLEVIERLECVPYSIMYGNP